MLVCFWLRHPWNFLVAVKFKLTVVISNSRLAYEAFENWVLRPEFHPTDSKPFMRTIPRTNPCDQIKFNQPKIHMISSHNSSHNSVVRCWLMTLLRKTKRQLYGVFRMMFSRQHVYNEFELGNSHCSYQIIYKFSINYVGSGFWPETPWNTECYYHENILIEF